MTHNVGVSHIPHKRLLCVGHVSGVFQWFPTWKPNLKSHRIIQRIGIQGTDNTDRNIFQLSLQDASFPLQIFKIISTAKIKCIKFCG